MSLPPDDDKEATQVADISELRKVFAERSKRDRAYLIVLAGSNVGEMYKIDDSETVIGRAVGSMIRLNDDGVSRRHARVLQSGGTVVIEDLHSANGTLVNETPVARHTLRDGDKIRIGSTTILKFTYHDNLDESFQKQMYDAALRDGLTHVFNKKYLLDRMESELTYAQRHGTPLSLLMLDVDHFKSVNDVHGHLAGDFVLTRIAKLASSTVQNDGVFARYGGEEFSALCRGADVDAAVSLAERIRSTIAASAFEFDGKTIPITVSVGVATFPLAPAQTTTELIAAADQALYDAKRGGRNRVCVRR